MGIGNYQAPMKENNMKKLTLVIIVVIQTAALLLTACGRKGPVPPPDKTPPVVTSTSPADGASLIPINSSIMITFSKEMDASTINPQTVTLTFEGGAVQGTVTCTGTTAVFKPSQLLNQTTTYTLTISTGVKDIYSIAMTADSHYFFVTETLPSVSDHYPATDAVDVPVNTDISVLFSEPVSGPTITFTLNSIDPTSAITGTVDCDWKSFNGTTAIFTPIVLPGSLYGLAGNTTYRAKVSAGLQDLQGKAMQDDYTWTFTTKSTPDKTSPTVSATDPTTGATDVPVSGSFGINVTFSELVTYQTKTLTLFSASTGTVPCDWIGDNLISYNSMTVTGSLFRPTVQLAYNKPYTATLSKTGVTDLAGNTMLENKQWTFTTQPAGTAISVVSSSPASTYGTPVTFLATVTPSTATGTVTFKDNGNNLQSGTVALNNGTAMYTISTLALGSHTITATYSGDATFAAATATQTPPQTVSKAILTVTADNKSKVYGATNPTLTARYTGFVLGDTTAVLGGTSPSLSTSATTTSLVGTYPIVVTQGTLAAANYNFSFVNGTLTVTGGAIQTITFGTLTAKTYGDAPFTLTATASSGLPVTYSSSNTSVATISGSTVTIVGGGTTTITANQSGDATYSAATPVLQILTVNKANQTISNLASSLTKTFGDADYAPGATASSGLAVSYASSNTAVATIVGSNIHIVAVGTATITASQSGNTNYNAAPNVTQTLTVNKANQTISNLAPSLTKTLGDADYAPGATASSGLAVSYASSNTAVATILGSNISIVAAGTATITASQAGNANYNAAPNVTQVLTINKAATTTAITSMPSTVALGASASVTITVTSWLQKATGNVTLTMDGTKSYLGDVTTTAGTVIITIPAADLTLGNHVLRAQYPGDTNFLGSQSDYGYLSVGATPTTTVITPPAQVVYGSNGSVTVTVSSGAGTPTGSVTLTVDSGLSSQVILSQGLVSGSAVFTIPILSAGSHTLDVLYAAQGNFGPSSASGTLTVVKATPTVSAWPTASSITYGQTLASSTLSGGSASVAGTFAFTAPTTAPGAGTAPQSVTFTPTDTTNYNTVTGSVNVTVNKADQTITFNPLPTKTTSDQNFDPGATASSGLQVTYTSLDPTVATIVGNKIHIVGTGTTTITASQDGNANYNAATPVDQPLTVQ